MNWKIPNDDTAAVITAQKHIASSHGNSNVIKMPETCIIFDMGRAVPFIESLLWACAVDFPRIFTLEMLSSHIKFLVKKLPTVSTDAVYRQTLAKESTQNKLLYLPQSCQKLTHRRNAL